MADDQDESLAYVGLGIYRLLERIASFEAELPVDSEALETLVLIINEGDRFKIWSVSTGLLVPGHGSLDYRVREAESLSKIFHSFLIDLRENLEEVLTLGLEDDPAAQTENNTAEYDGESDNESDDSNILGILLESIKDVINRLYRLATKLRSPETRLRSSRAQNFRILDNDMDLFQCFNEFEHDFVSSVFQSLRKSPKIVNEHERVASPSKTSKFRVDDESSKFLIERIARANLLRRRQFAYWKHHRLKLEQHTEAAITSSKVPKLTGLIDTLSEPIDLAPARTMTISTATELLNPNRHFDDLASIASVSEYMPLLEGERGDIVDFPPPPHVAAESKFFDCPYCFTTCAKKASRVKAWQAHLIHDLRPYMCTFENCRIADQLYDSKADWILHETTSHTTVWKCPVHPNEVFDGLVEFRLHAADGHVLNARVEANTLEAALTGPVSETGRSCPICTISNFTTTQLRDHVAIHLERFAIFSLPRHATTANIDDDDHGSNEANDDDDSRIFTTESDFNFQTSPVLMSNEILLADNTKSSTSTKPLVDYPQPVSSREELPARSEPGKPNRRINIHYNEVSDLLHQQTIGGLKSGDGATWEVEEKYANLLAEYEQSHGPNHTVTLSAVNNLASVFRDQGRFIEAEQMYNRALQGYEEMLGPDHATTLGVVDNIGDLFRVEGKLTEAEKLYDRVLAGYQKARELHKVSMLTPTINLGNVYRDQGKFEEAEGMYTGALAVAEKELGPNHLLTLEAINNLGKLYVKQDKLDLAERMYLRVLAVAERTLGQNSSLTLEALNNLNILFYHQNRFAEAEHVNLRALAGYRTVWGERHDITLASMANLASIYRKQGRLEGAEELEIEIRESRKAKLGSDLVETH